MVLFAGARYNATMQRIICQRCRHYFVTWEKGQPHGCRAYGFKSKQIPSVVVKQSSGHDCSYYSPKTPPGSQGETGGTYA